MPTETRHGYTCYQVNSMVCESLRGFAWLNLASIFEGRTHPPPVTSSAGPGGPDQSIATIVVLPNEAPNLGRSGVFQHSKTSMKPFSGLKVPPQVPAEVESESVRTCHISHKLNKGIGAHLVARDPKGLFSGSPFARTDPWSRKRDSNPSTNRPTTGYHLPLFQ